MQPSEQVLECLTQWPHESKAFCDRELVGECSLDSVALIWLEKKGTFENVPTLPTCCNEASWAHRWKLGASAEEQSGQLWLVYCTGRDTAQLLVLIRGINTEELAAMLQSITGTTTGSDCFTEVNTGVDKLGLDWDKLTGQLVVQIWRGKMLDFNWGD